MKTGSLAAIYVAAVLILGCIPPCAATEVEPGLGQFVLAGMASAVSRVRSAKGAVEVSYNATQADGRIVETKTKYDVAFSSNKFRFSGLTTYLRNDSITNRERQRTVDAGATRQMDAAYDGQQMIVHRSDERRYVIGDMFSATGRDAYVRYKLGVGTPCLGLYDLDPQKLGTIPAGWAISQPQAIATEMVGGDDCVVLEVVATIPSTTGGQITETTWFWVDPAKGFTVPRIRKWSQGGISAEKRLMTEVTCEVRAYGEGVWGPSEFVIEEYSFKKGTNEYYKSLRRVITYDPGYAFNADVSEPELSLVIPAGAKVYNELIDAEFIAP